MSCHYYYSFNLPLSDHLPASTLRVLTAVANGEPADPGDLDELSHTPQHYLQDPSRLLPPTAWSAGSALRLYQLQWSRTVHLSLEVCMHDDEYANGGYFLIIWLLSLCDRPAGRERRSIGYHALDPYDAQARPMIATAEGVEMDGDASSQSWEWWALDKAIKEYD